MLAPQFPAIWQSDEGQASGTDTSKSNLVLQAYRSFTVLHSWPSVPWPVLCVATLRGKSPPGLATHLLALFLQLCEFLSFSSSFCLSRSWVLFIQCLPVPAGKEPDPIVILNETNRRVSGNQFTSLESSDQGPDPSLCPLSLNCSSGKGRS